MTEAPPLQNRNSLGPFSIGCIWFTTLLTATVLFTGCVGPQVRLPWSVSDPPTLSPFAQSLETESPPYLTARPDQAVVTDVPGSTTEPSLPTIPEEPVRRQLVAPDPMPGSGDADFGTTRRGPDVPLTIPDGPEPLPRLSLLIELPASAAVDEFVTVKLVLANTTDTAAENVTVTCRFDEHLEFPGSTESTVEQTLGTLNPDDERELVLSLVALQAGRSCLELQLSSDTHPDATTEKCLEIRTPASADAATPPPEDAETPLTEDAGPLPQVDVSIVGPRRRTVGSRAEYVITLVNDSGTELPDSEIVVNYDPDLVLKEVSAGAHRENGRLSWDLGTYYNEERVQIQLEFGCDSLTSSAGISVTVTSGQRSCGRSDASLDVIARQELEMRLRDMADPLESGQNSTFVLEIENHGSQSARDIVVHLVPSKNIDINSATVGLGNGELDLNAFVEGQGLYFDPAPPLAPGDQLTYRIEFEAGAPGASELRAFLQSQILSAPIEVREPILINPRLSGE